MKHIYTFVLFFSSLSISFAQITLTSADFGSSGDTVRMTNASDLTADFLSTGPNHTWSFTQFTPASQTVKRFGPMSEISGFPLFVYGPTASVNYKASYYMDANIPLDQVAGFLPIQLEDIYQYSKKTADSITLLGLSMTVNGTAIPAKADTIETNYSFPLVYGNTHFSRGYTKLNMNPIFDAQWIQHRTRTTTVDGWGQLTTVYGTFNVLRVKHEITENDSIFYNGTWIELPVPPSTEYEWIAQGEKVPLLKMTTSNVIGNEQITSIEYRDNQVLGINDLTTLNVEIYPNPVSDVLHVKMDSEVSMIQLIDVAGRIVLSDKNPSLTNSYSIADLQVGTYQLLLTNYLGSKVVTIIKK